MQNKDFYIGRWITKCLLICFMVASCSRYPARVEEMLALSGSNRAELEKVLEHYVDSAEKREAAEFLIANMVGIYVVDSAVQERLAPFYEQCDTLRELYKDKQRMRWVNGVDSLWSAFRDGRNVDISTVPLLQVVTARQMIAEIDLAFRVWKENVYSRDCPFEEFCEYILPFYRGSFVLDGSRADFANEYKGFFSRNNSTFNADVDSLMRLQAKIAFSSFNGANVPAVSCGALQKMGGGTCVEKGVFNSLLFSALGMPITVDFVPLWGNRAGEHSWNVLVMNGKHYAFDPFVTHRNWFHNRLYANLGLHAMFGLGEFRCPKVYRKTYATHVEATLLDKGVAMEDIPSLFRNFKMIDVSAQYFEGTDVEVELTEGTPEDAEYAYLCVSDSKGWAPVQFGKIEGRKAVFRDMGRNIVYLPAYYRKGCILPAAPPLWLKADGETVLLDGKTPGEDTLAVRNMMLTPYWNSRYAKCLRDASITVQAEDGKEDTLCNFDRELPARRMVYDICHDSGVRFLKMHLPTDSMALGELAFYTREGRVKNPRISSALEPLSETRMETVFDRFTATCFRAKVKEKVLEIDLGETCRLTSVVIVPYVTSQITDDSVYGLYIWKESGWQLLEEREGDKCGVLFFENVPGNGLFRLDRHMGNGKEYTGRIFVYTDGEMLLM